MEAIGVLLDPATGAVMVAQHLYVALEVLVWLVALVLGLLTAWLVMP